MKKTGYLVILLFCVSSIHAQHTYHIPSVQPSEVNFENIHVMPLESDSLTSSFIIWVKQQVPAHYHRFHTEQVIVLSGEGMMQLGDQQLKVVAGDFVTIPKNTVHAVRTTSNEPLKVLSIQSPRFTGEDRILVTQ